MNQEKMRPESDIYFAPRMIMKFCNTCIVVSGPEYEKALICRENNTIKFHQIFSVLGLIKPLVFSNRLTIRKRTG